MEVVNAVKSLIEFYKGTELGKRIACLESCVEKKCKEDAGAFLRNEGVCKDVIESAFLVKSIAGQINVVIHALCILVSLPHILEEDEIVQYVSLGAGTGGKRFDLETDRRVAEFKLIKFRDGSPNTIRKNQLFKDFFDLAEYDGGKRPFLYVLGKEHPIKFLEGGRALKAVLSRNQAVSDRFFGKYGDRYKIVSQYYNDVKDCVEIVNLREVVPELADVASEQV